MQTPLIERRDRIDPYNRAKWLLPYLPPLTLRPFGDFGHKLQKVCAEAKGATGAIVRPAFRWKINALRHSFISYRVANTQDVARVALEAGNSPQVVFSNYRQLVSPGKAKQWFSISPS